MMNRYQRWHDQIIARAQQRSPLVGYGERHHIKPKCLGGSNARSNMVRLTYREHFLIHWLLTKIMTGAQQKKMLCAMKAMCRNRTVSGWQFAVARRAFSEAKRGNKHALGYRHTADAKRRTGLGQIGRKHTPEHRAKQGRNGVPKTAEHKRKISAAHIGKAGIPHTNEAKIKMSAAQRIRWSRKRHVEQNRELVLA